MDHDGRGVKRASGERFGVAAGDVEGVWGEKERGRVGVERARVRRSWGEGGANPDMRKVDACGGSGIPC